VARIEELRTMIEPPPAAAQVLRRLVDGKLGEYRLEGVLGTGSTGLVFRAAAADGTPRAVKVLRTGGEAVPNMLERFAREVDILQRLQVPGIVRVDGPMHVLGDDLVFFAMELLEGQDLQQRLDRTNALALGEALDVCLEVLVPLEAAHRAGIVHRDIKPANIYLLDQSANGSRVRLLDFGIAKQNVSLNQPSKQSMSDLSLGTPAFMAPEQILGEPVSGATDLYGVGSVLFQLITGRQPFVADSQLDLVVKKLQHPPPRLRTLCQAPERLEALLLQAMARKMEDRPHSAAAFASALKAIRTDLEHGYRVGAVPMMTVPAWEKPTSLLTRPVREVVRKPTGANPAAPSQPTVKPTGKPVLPQAPSFDDLPPSRTRWPLFLFVSALLGAGLGALGVWLSQHGFLK
jgi:serine/threonine-protein kinase